jgi:hypothetical protein
MLISVRPGTRVDYENWYGVPPEQTCRLWVAELDGKVAAIAGFTLEKTYTYAFSGMLPDLKVPPRTVFYWAGQLLAEMKKFGLPLLAKADPNMKNSGKFLEKLGFCFREKSDTGDIYAWNCSL